MQDWSRWEGSLVLVKFIIIPVLGQFVEVLRVLLPRRRCSFVLLLSPSDRSWRLVFAGGAIDKFLCCWRYSTTCWGSSYRSRCADSDLRDGSSRTRLRHWSHGHQLKHCRNDKVPGTAVKVSCSSQTGFSSTTEE